MHDDHISLEWSFAEVYDILKNILYAKDGSYITSKYCDGGLWGNEYEIDEAEAEHSVQIQMAWNRLSDDALKSIIAE